MLLIAEGTAVILMEFKQFIFRMRVNDLISVSRVKKSVLFLRSTVKIYIGIENVNFYKLTSYGIND